MWCWCGDIFPLSLTEKIMLLPLMIKRTSRGEILNPREVNNSAGQNSDASKCLTFPSIFIYNNTTLWHSLGSKCGNHEKESTLHILDYGLHCFFQCALPPVVFFWPARPWFYAGWKVQYFTTFLCLYRGYLNHLFPIAPDRCVSLQKHHLYPQGICLISI